jgi:hypothetical protein
MCTLTQAQALLVPLDAYDCAVPWWTPFNKYDRTADIAQRLSDWLHTMGNSPFSVGIMVGHSLFFRSLGKLFLHPALVSSKPQLCASFGSLKLENAGCMCITVNFEQVLRGGCTHGTELD